MSEVKRWTPDSPDISFSGSDNGEWVRYLHYQALEAERDEWEKKSDYWRDKCKATMSERDRYKAALEYIESTPTTWTLGVDENMERLRTIATQALGGGDE